MVELTPLETGLIIAHQLADETGYTPTLASHLGDMLRTAEHRYGPRDKSYTFLGIQFCGDSPRTWFTAHGRQIIILLSRNSLTSCVNACYELAHECIHLLSPGGRGTRPNVLEEGLATHFAHGYVKEALCHDMPATIDSYESARVLVEQLLALDPGGIKAIRMQQGSIYKASSAAILAGCPACPEELAERLAQPFVRSPQQPSSNRTATTPES